MQHAPGFRGSRLMVWKEGHLVLSEANMAFMKRRGAFAKENLQLHSINQMTLR